MILKNKENFYKINKKQNHKFELRSETKIQELKKILKGGNNGKEN